MPLRPWLLEGWAYMGGVAAGISLYATGAPAQAVRSFCERLFSSSAQIWCQPDLLEVRNRQLQPIQSSVHSDVEFAVSMCNVGVTGSAMQDSRQGRRATCIRGRGSATGQC